MFSPWLRRKGESLVGGGLLSGGLRCLNVNDDDGLPAHSHNLLKLSYRAGLP